jgi:hypothetical protein
MPDDVPGFYFSLISMLWPTGCVHYSVLLLFASVLFEINLSLVGDSRQSVSKLRYLHDPEIIGIAYLDNHCPLRTPS